MGKAAAMSKSMVSGMTNTSSARATTSSAKAPMSRQAITRSPARQVVTPGATSSTTPAASMPGMYGGTCLSW